MRAKKGTRMATATELLLVEPFASGSASVTFSLRLKPRGEKNRNQNHMENIDSGQSIYLDLPISRQNENGESQ